MTVQPHDDAAAQRLTAYFAPDGFPGYTLDEERAWTSEQVHSIIDHQREYLRQMIELSVREVLRELDEARTETKRLRGHDTNLLARQLADRTDELNTLRQQFDDYRDVCSGHSADRAAEQVRLDDAEAALVRYGNEMTRLCEAAKAFRAERDEARRFARRFRWLAFDGCDNGTSVFRQLGLDKLPDWFAAGSQRDEDADV